MNNSKTDLSRLAIGTVQFGIDYGISNSIGKTSLQEVGRILSKALTVGINTIDTASVYGNSEEVLGNCNIESFNITSKFPASIKSATALQQSIDSSLLKLRTNSLYGYLAHDADSLLNNPYMWQSMLELRQKGSVQKIGYSLYTPAQLEKLLLLNFVPQIVQVPYNFLDRRFEKYFYQLKSMGCEIHVRSAFLQGLFFLNPDILNIFFKDIKPLLVEIRNKLIDNNSIAGFLLNFVLENKQIDKLVFGVNSLAQLEANILQIQSNKSYTTIEFNGVVNEDILMPNKWPK